MFAVAELEPVMADPVLSEQVATGEQMQTGYVTINVEMEPFTDVRVRQALNYAVDKEVLAQVQRREVRLVPVDTSQSSPMASSLLFNWIALPFVDGYSTTALVRKIKAAS